jgi:hypothetical protein
MKIVIYGASGRIGAVALLDEAEQPRHTRTRFTVAY